MITMKMMNTTATRPNFDINATEGENDEVDFAIETPAGPFGFGSGVKLDNTQVGWSSNFVLVSILLSDDQQSCRRCGHCFSLFFFLLIL